MLCCVVVADAHDSAHPALVQRFTHSCGRAAEMSCRAWWVRDVLESLRIWLIGVYSCSTHYNDGQYGKRDSIIPEVRPWFDPGYLGGTYAVKKL